jgi:type II secretory pathway component PulF
MGLKELITIRRVSSKDKALFSRSLAATIEAGVPLLKAFTIMSNQTDNLLLKEVSIGIVERLEQGEKLSTALARYGKVFDEVYIYSVAAAEAGGKLEEVLKDLADRQEKELQFESALKSAIAYPSFVLVALIITTIFLIALVMPKVQDLIALTNSEVPAATKLLLKISSVIGKYYYVVILAIIALILWFRMFLNTYSGKLFSSRLVISMPIIRDMYINVYMARFAKTFQMLLNSGVPYLKTIELVSRVMDNLIIQKILGKVIEQVERGVPMSVPLAQSNVFPPLVSQMIAVGEQTGKLEDVMKSLNELYENQSDRNINLITSLLEPILLLVVAMAIGLVIFAVIIPIYQSGG